MLTVIYIFIIGSVFLILLFFFSKESYKLPAELREKMTQEYMLIRQRRKPVFFTYPFLAFNRWILGGFGWQYLSRQLRSAEVTLFPEEYLAIKEIVSLFLVAGVIFLRKTMQPLWIVGAVALFAFLLPDLYLRSRIRKRRRLIVRALPEAIDLLTLCVEGGLDFMLGLHWVVKRSTKSPLMNEFSLVLQEVKVGKSRQEALRDMAKRLSIPEVFSFVNTVVHAERMGTSVAEILKILSEEARRQRFQRGERLALQAPIKMLFPLIVFILPVVAIIIGGPIILQFLKGGLPKF